MRTSNLTKSKLIRYLFKIGEEWIYPSIVYHRTNCDFDVELWQNTFFARLQYASCFIHVVGNLFLP